MVEDAKEYEKSDKEKRQQIDTKNQADSLCYQSEKQLKDLGDKISETDKDKIQKLIASIRESINQENYDKISSLSQELQQELMQVGQKVYGQSSTDGGSTPEEKNTQGQNEDNVIDTDAK